MPAELNSYQEKLLEDIYYGAKNYVGRDRLFHLVKRFEKHPTQLQVMEWLNNQELHQLHQHPKRSTPIGPILVKKPGYFQADLIDMGDTAAFNKRYILTMIDAFTKQGYARALKHKTEESVLKAIKSIFEEIQKKGLIVTRLGTDNGSEFVNHGLRDFLDSQGTKHTTGIAGKPMSQGIIERWNGVLKGYIMQDITATGKNHWPQHLQEYVDNYNNSYHSTIKTTPNQAMENIPQVAKNIEERAIKLKLLPKNKLMKGDKVRVKIFKGKLDKYSKPNWSKAIYHIYKVIRSEKPYMQTKYRLINSDGQVSKNFYVSNDLLRVNRVLLPPAIIQAKKDEEEKKLKQQSESKTSKKKVLPPSSIVTRSKNKI